MTEQRFYSEDEAEQILKLAARATVGPEGLSRARLLQTAAELGISADAVAHAEKQVLSRQEDAHLRAEYHQHRKRHFYTHVWCYVIVNVFLVAINMVTDPRELWTIFPILGWGLGLAFHFVTTFKSFGNYEEEFEEWVRERARRRRIRAVL